MRRGRLSRGGEGEHGLARPRRGTRHPAVRWYSAKLWHPACKYMKFTP